MAGGALLLAGARPLLPQLQAAAARYSLSPELLAAVAWQESRFNPNAYNAEGDGSNPSRGLMQLRESTARGLGFRGEVGELFRPALSLELGAKLLRENINRVAAANPTLPASEMLARALAAYNAGWSSKRAGDAPRSSSGEFVNLRGYVEPVLGYYGELRAVLGLQPGGGPSEMADEISKAEARPKVAGVGSGGFGVFAILALLGGGLVILASGRHDDGQ